MSQKDYKEKVEAHRQSIDVEGDGTGERSTRMSRRQQRPNSREPKKNGNNALLTVLAVIFIMIPVSTLIYFFVLNPKDDMPKDTKSAAENVLIETNNNEKNESPKNESKVAEKQTSDSSAKADDKDSAATAKAKEKEAAEQAKIEQEKAAAAKEQAAEEKAAKERAAKEQAEKEKVAKERAAKEQAEKEEKEKADKEKADKEKTEPVKQSSAYLDAIRNGYLHNAVAGDTIQSISIKYYGSEAYVSQIKQLNGISADRVPAGTKVALIKP